MIVFPSKKERGIQQVKTQRSSTADQKDGSPDMHLPHILSGCLQAAVGGKADLSFSFPVCAARRGIACTKKHDFGSDMEVQGTVTTWSGACSLHGPDVVWETTSSSAKL